MLFEGKIKKTGFVYLTDSTDNTVDYFEVNTSAFPKVGIGTNIIFGKPRIGNGKIKLARYWSTIDAYLKDQQGNYLSDSNGNLIPDPEYGKFL